MSIKSILLAVTLAATAFASPVANRGSSSPEVSSSPSNRSQKQSSNSPANYAYQNPAQPQSTSPLVKSPAQAQPSNSPVNYTPQDPASSKSSSYPVEPIKLVPSSTLQPQHSSAPINSPANYASQTPSPTIQPSSTPASPVKNAQSSNPSSSLPSSSPANNVSQSAKNQPSTTPSGSGISGGAQNPCAGNAAGTDFGCCDTDLLGVVDCLLGDLLGDGTDYTCPGGKTPSCCSNAQNGLINLNLQCLALL